MFQADKNTTKTNKKKQNNSFPVHLSVKKIEKKFSRLKKISDRN